MTRQEAVIKLERIKNLAESKATGSPRELAIKLEISERSVYRLIRDTETVFHCRLIYSHLHTSYIIAPPPQKKIHNKLTLAVIF
jgi:hypothetical protein